MSPEELNKMEEVNLEGKFTKLQKSKDAFLFCCYAGLRYSDFINLTAANIVELHQETWLIYKSVKTGIDVRLPLYLLFEGKGLRVLENYKDDLNGFFKLKDNSNVNKDLNALAKLAEIDKRISFHTARHTNATLLIYSGANITTVQKLLGHKSVKTTQVYANIMDMTIVHDLEKISDHCSNIAIYTIQLAEGAAEFDTHAYVKQAYKETPQFAEKLKFYQNKYLTKIDEVEAME